MVHGDEGNVSRPGKSFCKGEAHEQGAEEAGAACYRNSVNVFWLKAGFVQGFLYHRVDPLGVFAAGDFGNHAIPGRVKGNLGCYYIREDLPAVLYHSGGKFIAGSFYTEYFHESQVYTYFARPEIRAEAVLRE